MGNEQSRRDDLEALGLMIAYFVQKLPWMGVRAKTRREKDEMMLTLKMETPLEALFPGCPSEFVDYMKYVRNLEFEKKPDYAYTKRLFQ